MISKKFVITDDMGLHARPAAAIADISLKYDCDVKLDIDGNICNAKSIISILSFAISKGKEVIVICDGKDEDKAIIDLEENVLKAI